jgi:murein DD-endopeptidase MepM/ murein hydrolase activator NlpD
MRGIFSVPRRLSPLFSLRAVALFAVVLVVGPSGAAPPDAGPSARDVIVASENPISAGPPVVSTRPPVASPNTRIGSADPPVVSADPPVVSARPPVSPVTPPVVSADRPASSAGEPGLSNQAISAGQPMERQTSDISGSYLRWPTRGRITQRYGCTGFYANQRVGSCRHFHTGIDIANAKWTPIRAMANGVVRFVGREPWGAWIVVLRHGNGLRTQYAHMIPTRVRGVSRGRTVKQGQIIGYMGKSGMATGVHLHFEVRRDGKFVNPGRYLPTSRP